MASDANAKRFLADNDPYSVHVQPAYKNYAYPTDVFEDVDSNTAYVPRQGENEVGQRVFYAVTPTGGASLNTSQYGSSVWSTSRPRTATTCRSPSS